MNSKIQEYVEYCLNCKAKPCSNKGCPLSNDIPTFIKFAKEGNIKEAFIILSKTTVLGSICGRICPHEKQCEGSCVRGVKGQPVKIGDIESYIFDEGLKKGYYGELRKGDRLKGKNVAVIGSGPSGLTVSAFLVRSGANVTIYEKYDKLGGILTHGIPSFRLESDVINRNIEAIINSGIEVELGKELGVNLKIEELEKKYDAIFLGLGANVPSKMNIEGENLQGVFGGNFLLESGKHPNYEGKCVAIIGGGNVAMDCARTIKRKGAKNVYVIYRRAEEQMPAERKEIQSAKSEGIEFLFQNNIKKIIGDNSVEKIECIRTKLVKKEGENREVPIDIENSNYLINIDYVITAIGSKPEEEIVNNLGLEITEKGYIKINEKYQTSASKIFAGGDLTGEKSTVAWASRTGRDAAKAIEEYLIKSDN